MLEKKKIDFTIVGADRIGMFGHVFDKIGTFNKAVLSKTFKVPFLVAFPTSTIDRNLRKNTNTVKIEERNPKEILSKMFWDNFHNKKYPNIFQKEFKKIKNVEYSFSVNQACMNADLIVLHTEWDEFKAIEFNTLKTKKTIQDKPKSPNPILKKRIAAKTKNPKLDMPKTRNSIIIKNRNTPEQNIIKNEISQQDPLYFSNPNIMQPEGGGGRTFLIPSTHYENPKW